MVSRCSYYKLTALATQLHGGFTCAWYCIAKIACSRLPVEKNRPRTPQSAPTTMGCPLPSGKVPLTQQVADPPLIQQHIPPHRPSQHAVYFAQARGGAGGHHKSSNRPDIKIRPDDGPRQIGALSLPPCSACIRERQLRNKTSMFRESSDGSAGEGQEESTIYSILFILF